MSKELIEKIEKLKQVDSNGYAWDVPENRTLNKAIEIINAHMEGKVLVPVEQLKELLGEITGNHSDKNSADFNDCGTPETDCMWCVEAKAMIQASEDGECPHCKDTDINGKYWDSETSSCKACGAKLTGKTIWWEQASEVKDVD